MKNLNAVALGMFAGVAGSLVAASGPTIDEALDALGFQVDTLNDQIATLELRLAEVETSSSTPAGPWLDITEFTSDVCDLACAFDVYQRSMKPVGADYSIGGRRLYIPAGDYTIDAPIVLCRKLTIEGAGKDNTRIQVSGEFHGIWLPTRDECVSQGYAPEGTALTGAAPSGSASVIRHLQLRGTGRVWDPVTNPTLYYNAGVMAENRMHLEHVTVKDFFTQGVRISADVVRSRYVVSSTVGWSRGAISNANLFSMNVVDIGNIRHSGVFIEGGDANAGSLINVNVTAACEDGDQYPGPCACVHDKSLIGNTHIAGHIADCEDRRGGNHYGVLTNNPASRNSFLGQYCEVGPDNGINQQSTNDIVLSGACGWEDGPGTRLQARTLSGICSPGVGGPVPSQVCIGNRAGEGMLSFQPTTSTVTASGAQFFVSRGVRWKFANRGPDAVLRRDVQNFGGYTVDEIYVGEDPLRVGDVKQLNHWSPPRCENPVTKFPLNGLGVESGTFSICEVQ